MASASVTEVAKNFERYQNLAQHEPVAITASGRETCYLISVEEYYRLKRRDRDVFDMTDMPADLQAAIGAAEMACRHSHLDCLLDD